jgi:hypothetical protein
MYLKVVLTLLLAVAVVIAVLLARSPGVETGVPGSASASPGGSHIVRADPEPLWATDPDPQLDRRIARLDLKGVTVLEALDRLRDEFGVNIVVGWPASNPIYGERVELHLRDSTLRAALRALVEPLGDRLHFTSIDGVIVTNAHTEYPWAGVTRLHDARDLIQAFIARPTAADPGTRTSHRKGYLPGEDPRARAVDYLFDVIQQRVAPDSWRDAGGSVGFASEWNGILVITHTPQRHQEIADLLESLRRGPQKNPATQPQSAP